MEMDASGHLIWYPTDIRCHLTDSLVMTLLTKKNTGSSWFLWGACLQGKDGMDMSFQSPGVVDSSWPMDELEFSSIYRLPI